MQRGAAIFRTATVLGVMSLATMAHSSGWTSDDLYRLRSVGDVQISPDGRRIAYTVGNHDRPGRPYSQLWVTDLESGKSVRFGGPGHPRKGAVIRTWL